MSSATPPDRSQLTIEELKTALREVVFESQRDRAAAFGAPRLDPNWPEVLVLMPFADSLRPIYEDHLEKPISRLNLRIKRADDLYGPSVVMQDVWSAINAARIIIADCTGRNPNVFYEIGLAHAIGKYTILIAQSIEDVPFDLRHRRVIVYTYTPRGMREFTKTLLKTIRSSLLATQTIADSGS